MQVDEFGGTILSGAPAQQSPQRDEFGGLIQQASPAPSVDQRFQQMAPVKQAADTYVQQKWDEYGRAAMQSEGQAIRDYSARVFGLQANPSAIGSLNYQPERQQQTATAYVQSTVPADRRAKLEDQWRHEFLANALPQAVAQQQDAAHPDQPDTGDVGRIRGLINADARGVANLVTKPVRAGAELFYALGEHGDHSGLNGANPNQTANEQRSAATMQTLNAVQGNVDQAYQHSTAAQQSPNGVQARLENLVEMVPGLAVPGDAFKAGGVQKALALGQMGASSFADSFDNLYHSAKEQGADDTQATHAALVGGLAESAVNTYLMKYGAVGKLAGEQPLIRRVLTLAAKDALAQGGVGAAQGIVSETAKYAATGESPHVENILKTALDNAGAGLAFGAGRGVFEGGPHPGAEPAAPVADQTKAPEVSAPPVSVGDVKVPVPDATAVQNAMQPPAEAAPTPFKDYPLLAETGAKHRVHAADGTSVAVPIEFENPVDRALYAATAPRKGKLAAEATKYLEAQGYYESGIAERGAELRDRVKQTVESGNGTPDATKPVTIPAREANAAQSEGAVAPVAHEAAGAERPATEGSVPGEGTPHQGGGAGEAGVPELRAGTPDVQEQPRFRVADRNAVEEKLPAEHPTQRDQRDEKLSRVMKDAYVVKSGLSEQHREVLAIHKELTGQDAIPYAKGRGRGFRLSGDTFYAVDKNPTPNMRRETIAHEATHWLQDNKPELVAELDKAIPAGERRKLAEEYKKGYARQEGKALDPAMEQKEVQAMAVGRAFTRFGVARQVMERNPSGFIAGVDAIVNKLRSLTAKGRLTNQVIETLKRVRGEAVKVQARGTADKSFLPDVKEFDAKDEAGIMAHMDSVGPLRAIKEPGGKLLVGPAMDYTHDSLAKFSSGDKSSPAPERRVNITFGKGDRIAVTDGEGQPTPAFLPGGAAAKSFAEEDVKPAVKEAAEAVGKAWDGVKRIFAPQTRGTEAETTKGVFRDKVIGERAQRIDRLVEAFEPTKAAMDKLPQAVTRDFIDKMEKGQKQTAAALQPVADSLRAVLDDRLKQVQALGTGKLAAFIKDYFPHLWKDPTKAASTFAEMAAKRPFEGRKSFLKKRSLPLFSDGIARGLEPVTENPVEAVMQRVREMDKYITAHDAFNELRAKGLMRKIPARGVAEAKQKGLAQINDNIATIFAKPNRKGGVSIAGYWMAPEPVATVANNFFSPGLRSDPHFGKAFRAYLGAGNVMNQAQLGLSAFHATFDVFDAGVSRMSVGIEQMAKGNWKEGAKSFGSAATVVGPAIDNFRNGSLVMREWYKPGSSGRPDIAAMVDAMKAAGGRVKMDDYYRTDMTAKMLEAFRKGNIIGGSLRAPLAGLEQAAKPVLEHLVPRMKLGVFMDIMRGEMKPGMTREELRKAAGKAWDSVDNRLGELVYDNLFWNKTAKDLAMATTRSVGWNLGTFRELGGGLVDFGKAAGKIATGQRAELTHRMAYTVALPLYTGIVGGVMHFLLTGTHPSSLKDLFFPQTGEKDKEGHPVRLQMPGYMADVLKYGKDIRDAYVKGQPTAALTTIKHKTHPMLNTIMEMLSNEDYYGTKIRNEDDPFLKRLLDTAEHAGTAFVPFGLRDVKKLTEEGQGIKSVLPLVGVVKARSDITQTDAEAEARDITKEKGYGRGRTQEQVDHSRLVRSLTDAVHNHDPDAADRIRAAVKDGTIQEGDVKTIKAGQHTPGQLERMVKGMDADQAMKVWQEADDADKRRIAGQVATKLRAAKGLTPERRAELFKQFQADWTRLRDGPKE